MPQSETQLTPHFKMAELRCKCGCNQAPMDQAFMAKLEDLRLSMNQPLVISSGYRCPAHNAAVSHTGEAGPHTSGCAADIAISGPDAHRLLLLAMHIGFSGIGVGQRGATAGRFIHLDDLPSTTHPRPRVWSY